MDGGRRVCNGCASGKGGAPGTEYEVKRWPVNGMDGVKVSLDTTVEKGEGGVGETRWKEEIKRRFI